MSDSNDFTLLENRLREPFLRMVSKHGRQKYGLWMVWTYMLWRSAGGEFCVPEELVLKDLGMNKNTLPILRNILVKEGWLRRDVLRDQGGKWLTRVWVITSPLPVEQVVGDANKSFISPPPVETEVGSTGNSGSHCSSVYCSPSSSRSATSTLSDSNSNCPEIRTERRTVRQSKDGGKPQNLEPQVKTCKNCGAVLLKNKGCACWTTIPIEEKFDDMDSPLDDWEKL